MFSTLVRWIRTHLNITLATIAGLAVVSSAILYRQWWGDRAWGVLIGSAVIVLVLWVTDRFPFDKEPNLMNEIFPWLLFALATITALAARRLSGQSFGVPVQLSIPTLSSPQTLLLTVLGLVLLVLLLAFASSLRKGDSVAIESHWGGLGGGISGWHMSAPLIYLLGIVFLLGVSVTMAWRMFPAPDRVTSGSPSASPSPPSPTSSPP